jgi:hypothetical protein
MWSDLSGFTEADKAAAMEKGMKVVYIKTFLSALLMSYMLSILVTDFTNSMGGALRFGLIAWLAIVVPIGINSILFEGKKKKLVYLNALERLVTIFVMVAVLSL